MVLVVQDLGVPILELKRHSPIAVDCDRPTTLHLAYERMQPKARNVHVFDRLRGVQGGELHPQAFGVTGLNARDTACLEMPSQTVVPKRLDLGANGSRCATRNTQHATRCETNH